MLLSSRILWAFFFPIKVIYIVFTYFLKRQHMHMNKLKVQKKVYNANESSSYLVPQHPVPLI